MIASAGVVVAVFLTRDHNVAVGDAAFPPAMAALPSLPALQRKDAIEVRAVIHPGRPGSATRSEPSAKAAATSMLGPSLEDLGVYSDTFADGGPAV